MRTELSFLISTLIFIFCVTACSQSKEAKVSDNGNLIFDSSLRVDGTSFYTFDSKVGQLYFMLDYGDNRGEWQSYGEKVRQGGANPLLFAVVERPGSTSFYALDSQTGQLHYTNDSPETGGKWNTYGDKIRSNGLSLLQFSASGRREGTSFYVFDSYEGQMYYLNDFGESSGKWAKYGSELKR